MKLRLIGDDAHLVAYWRLGELTGTALEDATGQGHKATLHGGYTAV